MASCCRLCARVQAAGHAAAENHTQSKTKLSLAGIKPTLCPAGCARVQEAGMKPTSHPAAGFRRLGTRLGPAARLSGGAEGGAVRATDDTANENLSPEEDPLGRKRKGASAAAASGGAAPDAGAERAAAAAAAPAAAEPPPAAAACGASARRSPSPAAGQVRAAPSSFPLECMCTGSGTRSHRTCCLACWHLSTRRCWVQSILDPERLDPVNPPGA